MLRWNASGSGLVTSGLVACLAAGLAGCPSVVETTGSGGNDTTGNTTTTTIEPPVKVDKVDLVLAIDNSRSMADKQQILALAVPDLVESLVNPPCLDGSGNSVAVPPDFGPLTACPAGSTRAFSPVLDIHVGIVSSSLGGHGADACDPNGAGKQSNNDRGRLLARLDPAQGGEVETYQNLKFLAWDPGQKLTPPGEADIDVDSGADGNVTALVPQLRQMVLGVGQVGCGYESQLEGWYRFLVDPSPPESVTIDDQGKVLLQGIDKVLLDQRKAFLRPDSALMVMILSDENDCSIMENGQFYFVAQQKAGNGSPFHLPKARAVCETSPGDECCFSCGQTGPKDNDGNPLCAPDPSCKSADGKTIYLDETTDNINLRCMHQKQRFGIDFLYSTDRYVTALTSSTVVDRNGQVVPNPIFSDLDQSDDNTTLREPGLVFLAGVVGVPWQDIARKNASGGPDLKSGLDADGKPVGGFQTPDQLAQLVPGQSYTVWDAILGDYQGYGSPKDPFMLESWEPRAGVNPITGEAIATGAMPLANKINGNEYTIPKRDDLQYACIFPLVKVNPDGTVTPDKRDCSVAGATTGGCDCNDKLNDNPLCQVNPATGDATDQVRAKAYPGLRELAVLKGLGPQGVVASVCPAQLVAPADSDFGYRPAMAAIIERLKPHFQ